MNKPKVLLFDVETAPILAHVWGLYDQNVGLNMVKSDWHLLAWAAKWLGDPPTKIMYEDQRYAKKIDDDKELLRGIWDLLNQADIVVTQNGKAFDSKKLNARFILNGYRPPSSYKHIDTKLIAKKKFAFTSNGLEYMSDKLCKTYKKLKHKEFPGFDLWAECLKGNKKAWKEMEKYNKHDVLALEELYTKLQPWDTSINFGLYSKTREGACNCGSTKWVRNGYCYTSVGKYQRYQCETCGAEMRARQNEFSKEERAALKVRVT